MNRARLFVASCISIGTAAMVFAIRGDVAGALSGAFHITNEQMGIIFSPAFYAFAIAILGSGVLVDILGMRTIHALSAGGFIAGVGLILLAPPPSGPVASVFDNMGTVMLYAGFFILGMSHGLVEGVINPLMASIYPQEKTKRITSVHAWWPAGMIVGGLLALGLTQFMHAGWQIKMALIFIPASIYLWMALSVEYPQTERATSNIPTSDMWKETLRPLFLVLFVCGWMTAAAELGPDQWFPKVMGDLVPQLSPAAGSGVLFLVYTAGLMFLLRVFGGRYTHKSPVVTLILSSILTGIGLYWLGSLNNHASAVVAITAATLFGAGKTFLWPTMIGITAEQFPRGGALVLSIIGAVGMLSVALVLPVMGERMDKLGPGAALQAVSLLGPILAVIFTGIWLYFRARGGYRAVSVTTLRAAATSNSRTL
ncbi:MAG: MFS transporter [Terriglobia bacterium]